MTERAIPMSESRIVQIIASHHAAHGTSGPMATVYPACECGWYSDNELTGDYKGNLRAKADLIHAEHVASLIDAHQ